MTLTATCSEPAPGTQAYTKGVSTFDVPLVSMWGLAVDETRVAEPGTTWNRRAFYGTREVKAMGVTTDRPGRGVRMQQPVLSSDTPVDN